VSLRKFLVWCPEDGESEHDGRRKIAAHAPELAAEEWAGIDDRESADYRILGGLEKVVHVREVDGEETRWIVRGEAVPSYWAVRAEGIRHG
jgi:hypothetical protein